MTFNGYYHEQENYEPTTVELVSIISLAMNQHMEVSQNKGPSKSSPHIFFDDPWMILGVTLI